MLLGSEMEDLTTFGSVMRPNGTAYGQGNSIQMSTEGMAEWRGAGLGKPTGPGAWKYAYGGVYQLLHMRNGREYSMFTPQANMKITLTEITSGNSGNGNFVIPHFYISACSNSVQCVKLHSIIMSILLYHFKQLTECIPEVEHIEAAKVNSKKRRKLTSISRIHIDYHALPTSQGIFTCSSEL